MNEGQKPLDPDILRQEITKESLPTPTLGKRNILN